jgi:hypothetical protein
MANIYWNNGWSNQEVHSIEGIPHQEEFNGPIISRRYGLTSHGGGDGRVAIVKDVGDGDWRVVWGDCDPQTAMDRFKGEIKRQGYWCP